ncbi:hypothetical protein EW145_g4632 [Phellinidium pouzarii]|uniref:Actin-like protein ARP6 n=1 Tax=Phellinidium pouzarii TaxID=167371 RepID=A0A4S4L2U1_9AGAM|nr:hypothetical protein EW145_g4632 [Phellinidium pouzarii]
MQTTPVVVLDNGASTIKAGIVNVQEGVPGPRIITNAIVRQTKGEKIMFFGHEFDQCNDFASLHFRLPFERGYLTDWDAQKAVWDGLFSKDVLRINPPDASLLITEPYFNLPNIQEQYDHFIFEEYDFQSYLRCTPASLLPYGSLFRNQEGLPAPECMLIVDSGYSYTHIVPSMHGKIMWKSVRRVDVGGKLLTNHLKELLSYRQYDLMGETYITNDVKEKCCYVSTNYKKDMEDVRSQQSKIVREYVLPRFSENRPGRIRSNDEMLEADDDILRVASERFAVPEVLFRPSDIGAVPSVVHKSDTSCVDPRRTFHLLVGLAQSGLARTIADAIHSLPEDLQGLFWSNIGLVGGNAKLPGFGQRLMSELRSLAPIDHEVSLYESSNPIIEAYNSGAELARNADFAEEAVTRAEYQEYGSNICRRKFANMTWRSRSEGVEERETRVVDKEKVRAKGRSRVSKGPEIEAGSGKKSIRPSRVRATANK